jgi:hypothetical protein
VADVSLAAHREVAQAARRHLDQAVAAALPLSGGKVRALLLALQRELAQVDAIRAANGAVPAAAYARPGSAEPGLLAPEPTLPGSGGPEGATEHAAREVP